MVKDDQTSGGLHLGECVGLSLLVVSWTQDGLQLRWKRALPQDTSLWTFWSHFHRAETFSYGSAKMYLVPALCPALCWAQGHWKTRSGPCHMGLDPGYPPCVGSWEPCIPLSYVLMCMPLASPAPKPSCHGRTEVRFGGPWLALSRQALCLAQPPGPLAAHER